MTRIGLLSDTHNYFDKNIPYHFADCDEIWHAGDFGNASVAEALIDGARTKPVMFRGVYGNVDGYDIRSVYPEKLIFPCEDIIVMMKHIGGYPGRYAPGVKDDIVKSGAALFISGHSHILKIMYDSKLRCLHMNPGACGKQGWHKVRTLIRFTIDKKEIGNCEVVELVDQVIS